MGDQILKFKINMGFQGFFVLSVKKVFLNGCSNSSEKFVKCLQSYCYQICVFHGRQTALALPFYFLLGSISLFDSRTVSVY